MTKYVEEHNGCDKFENAIRAFGIINACEWFGYHAEDDFTLETREYLHIQLTLDKQRRNKMESSSV